MAFGDEGLLVGYGASQDIAAGDYYLEIPSTFVMTRAIFKKGELGFMLERHPELFNDFEI